MRSHKIFVVMLVLGLSVVLAATLSLGAQALTEIKPGGLPTAEANSTAVKRIVTIVNGLAGAIALLIIVVNGLRYITSGGDPQASAKAKNGIVFALVGIAIVLAAQAIVTFVVTRLD